MWLKSTNHLNHTVRVQQNAVINVNKPKYINIYIIEQYFYSNQT